VVEVEAVMVCMWGCRDEGRLPGGDIGTALLNASACPEEGEEQPWCLNRVLAGLTCKRPKLVFTFKWVW